MRELPIDWIRWRATELSSVWPSSVVLDDERDPDDMLELGVCEWVSRGDIKYLIVSSESLYSSNGEPSTVLDMFFGVVGRYGAILKVFDGSTKLSGEDIIGRGDAIS